MTSFAISGVEISGTINWLIYHLPAGKFLTISLLLCWV